MSNDHTVAQGEYLSKLARKYGFSDYRTIWDHPNNAELKKKRQNPNVLSPGDKLFIPPRETKEESGSTEKKHRFEVKQNKLMLRLTLEDAFFKPIANAKCELTVEGETLKLVTDGKGRLEHEIRSDAEKASLVIKDSLTPINDQFLPIQIGHLDPVEELSGQKARLNNLGYFSGPLDEEDDDRFRSAVEEFQCEHMGPSAVDGKCGPKTQAKLKQVHGC
jgi:N-acetylmuramoyl-L-alanine amidase